ncbi:MAG: TIGR03915 family putative DNA repair protein [Bacilli bacterium]
MNYIILYDGSLDNLLSTIKYLFKEKIKPINIVNEIEYVPNLLDYSLKPDIKDDVLEINNKKAFKIIYYIYLSNYVKKELLIYYFLLNYFIYKNKIFNHRNLKCVNKALDVEHKVAREAHLLKGFIRFKLINNKFLYAKIKPDNNVLILLSNHFAKRLKNEYWVIEDEKNNLLSIYDKHNFYVIAKNNIKLDLNGDDVKWSSLWKTFFNTITIKERENRKCQRNFMPKKYWKNIIEMEDEL